MKHRVLFLEDSEEMQAALADTFRKECDFTFARTNREARLKLEENRFDLALLDLTLPDGDGFKICNFIRQSDVLKEIPIIFVTGRAEIEDKEMAFSIGADDYIVKPISPRELRARVLSRLRRAQRGNEVFTIGNLRFDQPLQKVSVAHAAAVTVLETTSRQFRILLFLARHCDHVFSRNQLLNEIWGEGVHLLERTVDSHVSHLRKKLNEAGAQFTIRPVPGSGYKFTRTEKIEKAA